MHENPFTKIRKQRIQEVKEMVRENQPIGNNKLVAMISVEFGTTEKTSIGMLKALQNAEFIEFDTETKVWKIKT